MYFSERPNKGVLDSFHTLSNIVQSSLKQLYIVRISFPFCVKTYFCLGLLGMSGIVSSIKPELSNGSKILFFIRPLFDSPTDSIITFKGRDSFLRVTSTFAAAARRVSFSLGQACDKLVTTCDKCMLSCDELVTACDELELFSCPLSVLSSGNVNSSGLSYSSNIAFTSCSCPPLGNVTVTRSTPTSSLISAGVW